MPRSVSASLTPLEIEDEKYARGRGRPSKSRKLEIDELENDLALPPPQIAKRVKELRTQMKTAAKDLQFEEAAILRDRIRVLELRELDLRGPG